MNSIWTWGIEVTHFLQNLGSWLEVPMKFFTFFGNEEFYMLVMPALYWCVDAVLGLRIGLMLVISGNLNGTAKLLFKSPRPYWVDSQVYAYSSEHSFGMPSGHAMNATSVWGLLAASLKKKSITIAAVLLIFLIGISRIYLGVHFLSDVLAGWLLGALLLLLYTRLEKPVAAWVKAQPLGRFILYMFLIAIAAITLNTLIIRSSANWQIPVQWLETSAITASGSDIDPLLLDGTITNTAIFFGLVSGVVWMNRKGGFKADGKLALKLARFVIGLTGVLLLWAGLGSIFPDSADLLGYALRFVRYALTGAWISAGAPLVFQKLGLADKGIIKEDA